MKPIVFMIFAVASLGALTGCSVLGIATKGDLEAAMQQEAVEMHEVELRLAALDEQLTVARSEISAVDRRLQPRLAALDSALAGNTERLSAATRHWTALQAVMVVHLDSLQTEFALVERDIMAMRAGMTLATAQAVQANANSQRAMQTHFDNLTRERDRLQQRLLELDQSLEAWPAELDSLPATSDGAEANPSEISRIDIRLVTPEEPAADATVAGRGDLGEGSP